MILCVHLCVNFMFVFSGLLVCFLSQGYICPQHLVCLPAHVCLRAAKQQRAKPLFSYQPLRTTLPPPNPLQASGKRWLMALAFKVCAELSLQRCSSILFSQNSYLVNVQPLEVHCTEIMHGNNSFSIFCGC